MIRKSFGVKFSGNVRRTNLEECTLIRINRIMIIGIPKMKLTNYVLKMLIPPMFKKFTSVPRGVSIIDIRMQYILFNCILFYKICSRFVLPDCRLINE